jgi:hypothetical protein
MIRIAVTAEAFEAIASMLPSSAVGYEAELNALGERLFGIERLRTAQAAARIAYSACLAASALEAM